MNRTTVFQTHKAFSVFFVGISTAWRVLLLGSFVMLAAGPSDAIGSVLGDLAAQMQPGEWRSFTPNNTTAIKEVGNWAVYADSATWDPKSRQMLFVGSYHGSSYKFVIYDEVTNSYSSGPQLPNIPFDTLWVGHGYDHNAIDPISGNFYYHVRRNLVPGANDVYKFDTTRRTWSALPINSLVTQANCCDALVYFPELSQLLWITATGAIYGFNDASQSWSLRTTVNLNGGTWQFAEYNPVHKVVVFGSGDSQRLFKIDANGIVTQLKNIPAIYPNQPYLYDGEGFTGHFQVDPASGDFIILTANATASAQLWKYNVLTDTWTRLLDPPSAMNYQKALVGTPVSTHAIVMYSLCGTYSATCDGTLWIYKHGASTRTIADTTSPSVPTGLAANPLSSVQVNLNWIASSDDVGVTGYRIYRNGTLLATANSTAYSDTGLTPQTTYSYSVAAFDAAGNLSATSTSVSVSTLTGPSVSGVEADFAARCSGVGVVKCVGFDSMGTYGNADLVRLDVDQYRANLLPRDDGQYRGTVDTNVKRSGPGSLRFQLDAGYASSNIAGQYLPLTNNGLGSAFSENSTMYLQFAVRFSPEYFSNQNTWNSTPKIAIFHANTLSCASKELTINQWGGSAAVTGTGTWAHMYKDCGGQAMRTQLDGYTWKSVQQGTPYLFQQGEYYCDYAIWSNCFVMPANKWITFYFKVQFGTWGSPNSTIEAWYSIDGQPYKKWLNVTSNFTIGCDGAVPCPNEVFNNLSLTPYMTNLTKPASATAYVWYDELIVSKQPIAAPSSGQTTQTPPAAPSGLALQ